MLTCFVSVSLAADIVLCLEEPADFVFFEARVVPRRRGRQRGQEQRGRGGHDAHRPRQRHFRDYCFVKCNWIEDRTSSISRFDLREEPKERFNWVNIISCLIPSQLWLMDWDARGMEVNMMWRAHNLMQLLKGMVWWAAYVKLVMWQRRGVFCLVCGWLIGSGATVGWASCRRRPNLLLRRRRGFGERSFKTTYVQIS